MYLHEAKIGDLVEFVFEDFTTCAVIQNTEAKWVIVNSPTKGERVFGTYVGTRKYGEEHVFMVSHSGNDKPDMVVADVRYGQFTFHMAPVFLRKVTESEQNNE